MVAPQLFRTASVMLEGNLSAALLVATGLLIGFLLGYAVRSWISYRRKRKS